MAGWRATSKPVRMARMSSQTFSAAEARVDELGGEILEQDWRWRRRPHQWDLSHSGHAGTARASLKIFWTPEIQQAVLGSFQRSASPKDVAILSSGRGFSPATGARRVS
jgi:hypothetical protein